MNEDEAVIDYVRALDTAAESDTVDWRRGSSGKFTAHQDCVARRNHDFAETKIAAVFKQTVA